MWMRHNSGEYKPSTIAKLPIRLMVLFALLACACIGQTPRHRPLEQLSRQGFTIPKEGFVPTADVALTIAEAVLVPVYGKDIVQSERPFHATLKRDVWIVTGTAPCEGGPPGVACPGGNAEVRISKKTGRIIYMMHSM